MISYRGVTANHRAGRDSHNLAPTSQHSVALGANSSQQADGRVKLDTSTIADAADTSGTDLAPSPVSRGRPLSPAESNPIGREPGYSYICPDGGSASIVVEPQHVMFRYANVDGRALLQRGYPARLSRGTLEVASERGAALFRQALTTVRQTASSIMVVADGEGGPFSIRISLWTPRHSAGPRDQSVAILDIRLGSFELTSADLQAISAGFGLTEAETAVLGLLADGLTLSEIARRRRVELDTVRAQCKAVLAKMGCHRQVDLIRLLTSLCSAGRATAVY